MKQLLTDRVTGSVIKGMKGKSGKSFDAKLVLELGEYGRAIVRPKFR